MMKNDQVIGQAIKFLSDGRFSTPGAENDLCH